MPPYFDLRYRAQQSGSTTFRLQTATATGRTNLHFTLKENTLKRSDLDDFVNCYFGSSGAEPALKVPNGSAPKSDDERSVTRPLKAVEYETAPPTSKDKESAVTDRRYNGNRNDQRERPLQPRPIRGESI